MELAIFWGKKFKISMIVILKIESCRTMCKIYFGKIVKIQDIMDKTNLFFDTLPFSPWAMFPTWLHLGAPQENIKIFNI
jgi:hypothetical protein